MKSFALIAFTAAAALAGCVTTVSAAGGGHIQQRSHQTVPASGITSVRVSNVSGTVTVTGWNQNGIGIDAVKRANDSGSIARTHVDVTRNGDELAVSTRYDKNGLFGSTNGASVDYTIRVPATENVNVANVSGDISIHGVSGDVSAKDVSGDIKAALGRVGGSRTIRLDTISGALQVQMAKNSDASVQAKTISGAIHTFFPSDITKGYVGEDLKGTVGSGAGKIDMHTVSGAIDVSQE